MSLRTPPNPHHPAIAFAPKNLREALQRIVDKADQGNPLAQNVYHSRTGCTCAIGLFFTPEQLEDIKRRHLNCTSVGILANHIGVENVEFMTGMNLDQARAIQRVNDCIQQSLVPRLKAMLRDGSGTIGGTDPTQFKLD